MARISRAGLSRNTRGAAAASRAAAVARRGRQAQSEARRAGLSVPSSFRRAVGGRDTK